VGLASAGRTRWAGNAGLSPDPPASGAWGLSVYGSGKPGPLPPHAPRTPRCGCEEAGIARNAGVAGRPQPHRGLGAAGYIEGSATGV